VSALSKEDYLAYLRARSEAVATEATFTAFQAEWGPRLAALGFDLDGTPLAADPDEIYLDNGHDTPAAPNEAPSIDWSSLGVVEPQQFGPDSAAVDFLEFVAQGDGADDQEWFVEGLIPKNGLTIIGADPKSGKTLMAYDLGFAAATGRQFLGRETDRATFLYVSDEGPPAELRKRARRLIAAGGLEPGMARIIFGRGITFDDPRSWLMVRDEVARIDGPTLLVLDPLRDMLTGDENDSSVLNNVGKVIMAILHDFPDVTAVLLHHLAKRRDGRGGQMFRGSSVIWAKANCAITLETDPIPDNLPEGQEAELRGRAFVEPRNGAKFKFQWRWDPETGHIIEAEAEARTLADRAAAILSEHGPATLAQLAEALGTTADSVRVSLTREHARFRAVRGDGPNDPSTWELAE
jgi:hypothetical protein